MSLFARAADLLFELDHVETLPMELARATHVRIVDERAVGRATIVLLREFKHLATAVSTLQTALETAAEVGYFLASRDDFFGDSPYLGDDTSRTHMDPYVEAFCGVFATSTVPVERRGLRSQPTKHCYLDANGDTWMRAKTRAEAKETRKRERLEAQAQAEAHAQAVRRRRDELEATIAEARIALTQLV